MYELAQRLTPDALEAIATQLYIEMLEAGYTSVGEFHYLHHDIGGVPFARRSEMSERLLAAADASGIGITLLPVLYRWSGFGALAPLVEQSRFVNTVEAYVALLDELAPLCQAPNRRLGVAPHSLRAVAPNDLHALLSTLAERGAELPIHLHIAEQSGEVDAALAHVGSRPIEWLLHHANVDARWTLVHATHVNIEELDALAATGATVCVSPTTEANLGDGIFPLAMWRERGGPIAIGSDSQVSVDVTEELRWLEYVQRLRHHERAVTPSPETLYMEAARAGGRALGRQTGVLAAGYRADFLVLDPDYPAFAGGDIATLVDRFVIAGGSRAIHDVFVGGDRVVANGRHHRRDAFARAYRTTVETLFPA